MIFWLNLIKISITFIISNIYTILNIDFFIKKMWFYIVYREEWDLHGWFLGRKYQSARHKICLDWVLLGTLTTFQKDIWGRPHIT